MDRRILAVLATLATMLTLVIASSGNAVADNSVTDQRSVFRTTLSGRQEVPAVQHTGTGQATVTLRGNQACFVVSWARIGAPFAAHIHRGAVRTNGPVVVPFFSNPRTQPLPASLSGVQGCGNASPAVLADIRANPARYYINIHNARYPDGAIRGQLR
jgi:CHRD domain